jgi:hypothetical protein
VTVICQTVEYEKAAFLHFFVLLYFPAYSSRFVEKNVVYTLEQIPRRLHGLQLCVYKYEGGRWQR